MPSVTKRLKSGAAIVVSWPHEGPPLFSLDALARQVVWPDEAGNSDREFTCVNYHQWLWHGLRKETPPELCFDHLSESRYNRKCSTFVRKAQAALERMRSSQHVYAITFGDLLSIPGTVHSIWVFELDKPAAYVSFMRFTADDLRGSNWITRNHFANRPLQFDDDSYTGWAFAQGPSAASTLIRALRCEEAAPWGDDWLFGPYAFAPGRRDAILTVNELKGAIRRAAFRLDSKLKSLQASASGQPLDTTRSREAIPEHVCHEVWRRDQGKCVRCGTQERLAFDHIVPHSLGGADTVRNLQLLCEACNQSKGNRI